MARKNINEANFAGPAYEHKLELKVTGPNSKNPGTEFITGTLSIATDDDMVNISDIHYTYVTATTGKGTPNNTFNVLKNFIDGNYKTYMNAKDGESPTYLRVNSAIDVNDFYTDRNGEVVLASVKRNEGGFLHVIKQSELADQRTRNQFKTDMVITKVRHIDADEERNLPEKAVISGVIFNFRNEIKPVEYSVVSPAAINYFEGYGISPSTPLYTQIRGEEVNENIKINQVFENAFGDDIVETSTRSRRDFVVIGASTTPYVFDDETTITVDELQKAVADRNTYLATIRARYDDYQASKGTKAPTAAPTAVKSKAGSFDF